MPLDKETYFTPDSLKRAAGELLEQVRYLRDLRSQRFEPSRAALLVVDMQRYFLEERSHAWVPSARALIPTIAGLAREFSRAGRPVILTRHGNTSDNAARLGDWWGDYLSVDDPLRELIPEVAALSGRVVDKTQYDAFHGTELEPELVAAGVDQVVVCGVMTHLCCETTARSAFVRGFAVFLPVDGTATYNRELHLGSLRGLAHGFAFPVLAAEVAEAFHARH